MKRCSGLGLFLMATLFALPAICRPVEKTVKLNSGRIIRAVSVARGAGLLKIVSSEAVRDSKRYKFPVNSTLNISDCSDKAKSFGIVSGSYLASFAPPTSLGYVKISGDIISRKVGSWLGEGLFCTNGRRAYIGNFDQGVVEKYPDCIQAGPLLVKNGEVKYDQVSDLERGEKKLLRDEQEHSFVCEGKKGELMIGISTAMKIDDFASALAAELSCKNALRLTGASTAGLVIKGKIYGNDELPLSTVILVK